MTSKGRQVKIFLQDLIFQLAGGFFNGFFHAYIFIVSYLTLLFMCDLQISDFWYDVLVRTVY